MYSGRPCENSLQRRRVEGRKYLYENITKVIVLKVFQNSVLVFICKLANQRRQRLPIHRFYRHTGTQVSRKEYCCAPLIQTPNLSLVGIYVWFWQTQTDFGVWNSATIFIFIYDNGWYIYIWQSETMVMVTGVSHVSMNTANMHFSINDFRMVSRLDKNAVFCRVSAKK
jgi:hypothetical protein